MSRVPDSSWFDPVLGAMLHTGQAAVDETARFPGVAERFWAKVDVRSPDECWLWTAARTRNGYGYFLVNGKQTTASRVAYELTHGPLSRSEMVDHRVACPKHCVNPNHLRAVTRSQNGQNRAGADNDSRTGVRGVTWDRKRGQWQVQARSGGRNYHGGRFDRLEDAQRAAVALRLALFTHNDMDRGNRA